MFAEVKRGREKSGCLSVLASWWNVTSWAVPVHKFAPLQKKNKNSSNPLKCSSASIIRKKIIKSTQNVICYPLLHLMSDEYYYCKSLRLISIQLLHIPLGALIYSVTSCSMCCLWRSFPVWAADLYNVRKPAWWIFRLIHEGYRGLCSAESGEEFPRRITFTLTLSLVIGVWRLPHRCGDVILS